MSTLTPAYTGPTITTVLNLSATKLTPMCHRGPKVIQEPTIWSPLRNFCHGRRPRSPKYPNAPQRDQQELKSSSNAHILQSQCSKHISKYLHSIRQCPGRLDLHELLRGKLFYCDGTLFSWKNRWDKPSDWERQPVLQLDRHLFALDTL